MSHRIKCFQRTIYRCSAIRCIYSLWMRMNDLGCLRVCLWMSLYHYSDISMWIEWQQIIISVKHWQYLYIYFPWECECECESNDDCGGFYKGPRNTVTWYDCVRVSVHVRVSRLMTDYDLAVWWWVVIWFLRVRRIILHNRIRRTGAHTYLWCGYGKNDTEK